MLEVIKRSFTSLCTACKPAQVCANSLKLSEAQRGCPFVRSLGAHAANTGLVASLARHCPVMQKFDCGVYIENDLIPSTSLNTPLEANDAANEAAIEATDTGLFYETYEAKFDSEISSLHAEGRYRVFANLRRHCGSFPQATVQTAESKMEIKIFCSNDYLGMGQQASVLAAMEEALHTVGAGAGGTRNISGTTKYHVELEAELASLHTKEAALVMTSCFVANEAALSVLGKLLPEAVVISDAANHASMIEGIRHSKLEKKIFRHNDYDHLEEILQQFPITKPKVIVFESVYSMSGTIADIPRIVRLAKKYNALTFLDEVHAVGMYGASGAGVAEADGVMHQIDVISGTLGKAYGVGGGYIAGSRLYVDCVRSFAPGFIFTTAVAPVIAAGALASVRHLRHSQVERQLQQLRAKQLKEILKRRKFPIVENNSHIVPVLVRDPVKCKALTDALLFKHKIYLQPINYPTVAKGQERVRITPGPLHSEADLEFLADALDIEWDLLGLSRQEWAEAQTEAKSSCPRKHQTRQGLSY